jgi:hypothetical protein
LNEKINEKMKNLLYFVTFCSSIFLWASCTEEGRLDQIPGGNAIPAQVKNVTVENLNGSAVLRYKVPIDSNLLYVKAVYEIRPGVSRESYSSYYEDTLRVDGFSDTTTYNVNIYSVGKNGKCSEPLIYKVKPLISPINQSSATLGLVQNFGGVKISLTNEQEASFAIVLLRDSANIGHWNTLKTFYAGTKDIALSFRGLDSVPQKFGVYIQDHFGNASDTIVKTLTPWFEQLIPKDSWTEYHLPTDTWQPYGNLEQYSLHYIWDGITSNADLMFCGQTASPLPQWATWDLGQTVILSRFKVFQRLGSEYASGAPKDFEIWGSVNPNPDGSWDSSWFPIGKYESYKLSAGTTITQEDRTYANVTGIDFDVAVTDFAPNPFVPVRYIRFKTLEIYSGPSPTGPLYLAEITFWGRILH